MAITKRRCKKRRRRLSQQKSIRKWTVQSFNPQLKSPHPSSKPRSKVLRDSMKQRSLSQIKTTKKLQKKQQIKRLIKYRHLNKGLKWQISSSCTAKSSISRLLVMRIVWWGYMSTFTEKIKISGEEPSSSKSWLFPRIKECFWSSYKTQRRNK